MLQPARDREPGAGELPASRLAFAPAFQALDTRRVLGLPESEAVAPAAVADAQALAPCRDWAGAEAELCPICRPAPLAGVARQRR